MITDMIHYDSNGLTLKGYLVYAGDVVAKRPAVLVAHAWKGQDEFARQQAHALAELGYIGFAIDMFGEGKTAQSDEEASKLMTPLFLNRALLRERVNAAVEVLQKHPMVDSSAIGAIGFCFGGLAVIELLRSGADVSGVVSFHGTLGSKMGEKVAKKEPTAANIQGSLLILHGYKDPLVSAEDLRDVQEEFSRHGIDWQINIYGQAKHAFTNPEAHNEEAGLVFNSQAALRSWQAMCNFFEEIFP